MNTEHRNYDGLKKKQEKIEKIQSQMPRGTNLYMHRRQKMHKETLHWKGGKR